MNQDIERKHGNARMSKLVRYGGLVFLAGQTASGGVHAGADIATQTKEVLSRVDALLEEAGSDRSRILSATVYLRKFEDFAVMNEIWEAWISPGQTPARTTVEAGLGLGGLRVEITVVAAVA